MKVTIPRVICTAKPEPYEWHKENRSGIIYRVEISDGSGNLRLMCEDAATYNTFEPFQAFEVVLNVNANRNGDPVISVSDAFLA